LWRCVVCAGPGDFAVLGVVASQHWLCSGVWEEMVEVGYYG